MTTDHADAGARRVAAYLEALRERVQRSETQAATLRPRQAGDPALAEHIQRLDDYAQALGQLRRGWRQGQGTPADTRQRLDQLWRAVRSPEAHRQVAAWHADAGAPGQALDTPWLDAAFTGPAHGPRRWQADIGPLGVTAWRPLRGGGDGDGGDGGDGDNKGGEGGPAPSPAPAPSPHSPPPMRICTVAPYEEAFPDSATSGIAVLETNPSATPADGRLMLSSTTAAPVLAGGGTDSRALLGSTVKWPEGYGMMSLTATIRLDVASLYAITILGGATASAELLMTASLSIGGQYSAATPLGAAVAPLLWHTDLSLPGTYTVAVTGIPLNGLAGEAKVAAGVHDNTAGVGVVGSSGATTFLLGQLLSICVDLY